jgi:hypothetical protein
LRRALEEPRSQEYIVILLRIEHEDLAVPVLVANDVVNYVYQGDTYLGFPFKFELISDSNQVPRGQLAVQNVDERIGEAIINLTTPPRLTILMFASSDFTDLVPAANGTFEDTRYQLTEDTTPEYQADHLILANVSGDAMQITGELQSFDMSNEPWPAIRSTADRLPGLVP